MKKTQGAVFDRRVGAVSGIFVTVYNQGTANKPTIYSDNGVNPQANPFQTDSLGRWAFYVANGRYDIEFSGSTINTFKLEDVLIEQSVGGVTDHGALTGLADDDHTQYFLVDGTRNAAKIIITDGANHYLQIPQLTTAQRDGLTPVNGMIIYNSTTAQFERYQAGTWAAFGGVTDHGGLTGLGDDDHTQYLLANGTRNAAKLIIIDGADHYLQVPQLTTAQRDGLTPVNGMIIYNSTTIQFERYQAGAWAAFGGVTDHGQLTGLGDDDHLQYFLVDGTRNATKLIITDGADHYLQIPQLTTTQRDALTPVNGMLIYNSTTGQFERYQNSAWGAFGGVSDHGQLTGLGDDDHPQYLFADGTRNAAKIIITDGANHYLQVPQLTTTQRDALTPVNGMIIYNSTTVQFERYQGGAWGAFGGGSGKQRIRIPAAAFETRVNAGWAAFAQIQGTNFDWGELCFDKDTDEKAISPPFRFSNWNAGNITVRIGWKANATTGNMMWVISFLGRDTTTPEVWDAAFTDHALNAETTPGTAEYLKESIWTGAVGELANNDAVLCKITRDANHASDTLAVDAKLLYVEIEYTEA
jgi:hypothetical protein